MDIAGPAGEFLVLEYSDGDRVYVPVAFTASGQPLYGLRALKARRCTSSVPINGPGRASERREQIRDVAAELLDLYARRKAQQACDCRLNELDYQTFANAFPFEETRDQAQAIRAVLADLRSDRPMDRDRVRRCRIR